MPKQTYLLWRAGAEFVFRIGPKVHRIPWSLQRERELQRLMAQWQEHEADEEKSDE